ncbi:Sporulation related domain protein [Sulfitobacter sp. THAF37]|uniref:SPOR domain-containing protein n=1 Tax=Sulfitobacter sp. THAF37 TaxID=2587855 RepID=UPI0012AA76D1|nr:SPOR domain-containing protein [Sulfitobacter sp. THAF37]QFT59730.1 Sporulation related domain protein [Sulfitobacter sp. THAF37]
MADFDSNSPAGDYPYDSAPETGAASAAKRLKKLTNVAGAAISLALIAGIGVWGYKLLVRDVSGIPVVRAASGDMRVRPEEPGGELADHQGLSVNVIAAEGTAGKPADELRLAPRPVDLTEDDQVVKAAMVTDAPQERKPAAAATASDGGAADVSAEEVASALQSGDVDDLVAKLTEGVAPLSDINDETDAIVAEVTEDVVAEVVEADEERSAAVMDAPGVRYSLRPRRRPAELAVVTRASLTTVAATPAASVTEEVDPATLAAGTRLAQLGAFDSAEVAREQWDQLQGRFGMYLDDKKRVIQKASSGGRVFYRLRAMGFEDIADARRFCSALVAENADCIPVVTR